MDINTINRSDLSTPKMRDVALAYMFFGPEAAEMAYENYDYSSAAHLAVVGAILTKATPAHDPRPLYTGDKKETNYKDIESAYLLLTGGYDAAALAHVRQSTGFIATLAREHNLI